MPCLRLSLCQKFRYFVLQCKAHAYLLAQLEYGLQICEPNLVADVIKQMSATLNVGYRAVNWSSSFPCKESRQRLGLHSLHRLRVRADHLPPIKINHLTNGNVIHQCHPLTTTFYNIAPYLINLGS